MGRSYGYYARRARQQLARKLDNLPVTPEAWQSEMQVYFDFFEDAPEPDWYLGRDHLERIIRACPHQDVRTWARDRLAAIEIPGPLASPPELLQEPILKEYDLDNFTHSRGKLAGLALQLRTGRSPPDALISAIDGAYSGLWNDGDRLCSGDGGAAAPTPTDCCATVMLG